MGRILKPVYIMMKKKAPVWKNLGNRGLSSMTSFSRVTTFSTKEGSKVSSSWTTCGMTLASESMRLARGSGRITALSTSLQRRWREDRNKRERESERSGILCQEFGRKARTVFTQGKAELGKTFSPSNPYKSFSFDFTACQ